MRRDQLPSEPKRSYVLAQYKTVYVSTPKAACTSLKWVIATLAGEDLERFDEVIRPGTTPAGTIHPRKYWQRTPSLHDLTDAELADISGANGWHLFAVVRHPATRLWSAWQEKLLLREPHMGDKFPESLVPPLPTTTADIVQAFHRFVAAMVDTPVVMNDPHFGPQHDLLAASRFPYTQVYTTRELDQAMRDLQQQVTTNGGGRVPNLLSDNETPLRPLRALFADDVLATIRQVYAADFDAWFPEAMPPGLSPDSEYLPSQLAEISRLVDRHARIGQLAALAERLQRQNRALRRRKRAGA